MLKYFLAKLRSGEFVVDTDYLRVHDYYPIKDIERLLACFERNINDRPSAALLDGRPIVFALICRAVWDALAGSVRAIRGLTRSIPGRRGSATTWFQQLFEDVPVAQEIYQGNLTKISKHLRELSVVSNFLAGRGLAWRPAEDPGQDYPEEMRQYLEEAKRTFRDSAVLLKALKDYEREVSDLLKDD